MERRFVCAVLMGDFDCCTTGTCRECGPRQSAPGYDGNPEDPTSKALARAFTRNREQTARLSDAESELARVRRELGAALNTITGLRDELRAAEMARLGLRPGWLENIISSSPQRTVIDLDGLGPLPSEDED
jgi:hypothetical protein